MQPPRLTTRLRIVAMAVVVILKGAGLLSRGCRRGLA